VACLPGAALPDCSTGNRGLDVALKRVYSKEITRKWFRGVNLLWRQASDLLYEENTIIFRNTTRGRYGLTGRCSGEYRNRYSSAGVSCQPAGASVRRARARLRRARTSLYAIASGHHGPDSCGVATGVLLWLQARLVWLSRQGSSLRLEPSVVGAEAASRKSNLVHLKAGTPVPAFLRVLGPGQVRGLNRFAGTPGGASIQQYLACKSAKTIKRVFFVSGMNTCED